MRTAIKSTDLISKKKQTNYLHVQHTLLCISLSLFFTNTMPFCTTKTSSFLVKHYFSLNYIILSYVLTKTFGA